MILDMEKDTSRPWWKNPWFVSISSGILIWVIISIIESYLKDIGILAAFKKVLTSFLTFEVPIWSILVLGLIIWIIRKYIFKKIIIKRIDDIIEKAEKLKFREENKLDKLVKRAKMLIERIFGEDSSYIKELKGTFFHTTNRKEWWDTDISKFINLLKTIKEDIEFFQ